LIAIDCVNKRINRGPPVKIKYILFLMRRPHLDDLIQSSLFRLLNVKIGLGNILSEGEYIFEVE